MKLLQVVRQETDQFHFKWYAVEVLLSLLPINVFGRMRTYLMRLAGFKIGTATIFSNTPRLQGDGDIYNKLVIGDRCYLNTATFFELGDHITIGNDVAVGHEAMFLTTSHDFSHPERRGGDSTHAPIYVGDGAWIAARATILPGVTIGEGAIVAAGAVVTKDVAPHTLVGGMPAKLIRHLEPGLDAIERKPFVQTPIDS